MGVVDTGVNVSINVMFCKTSSGIGAGFVTRVFGMGAATIL